MAQTDEDDKPTVVLDLNALKKQKLQMEEELANIDVQFNVLEEPAAQEPSTVFRPPEFKVILFDFQSDFFAKSLGHFPEGYEYVVATTLSELNRELKTRDFQIVIFNYDTQPKAVNQLCAQIKQKLPTTKTLIVARSISPEKAKLHARTAGGAQGYFQLPLEHEKLDREFQRMKKKVV